MLAMAGRSAHHMAGEWAEGCTQRGGARPGNRAGLGGWRGCAASQGRHSAAQAARASPRFGRPGSAGPAPCGSPRPAAPQREDDVRAGRERAAALPSPRHPPVAAAHQPCGPQPWHLSVRPPAVCLFPRLTSTTKPEPWLSSATTEPAGASAEPGKHVTGRGAGVMTARHMTAAAASQGAVHCWWRGGTPRHAERRPLSSRQHFGAADADPPLQHSCARADTPALPRARLRPQGALQPTRPGPRAPHPGCRPRAARPPRTTPRSRRRPSCGSCCGAGASAGVAVKPWCEAGTTAHQHARGLPCHCRLRTAGRRRGAASPPHHPGPSRRMVAPRATKPSSWLASASAPPPISISAPVWRLGTGQGQGGGREAAGRRRVRAVPRCEQAGAGGTDGRGCAGESGCMPHRNRDTTVHTTRPLRWDAVHHADRPC
jgi:hypothetical protein